MKPEKRIIDLVIGLLTVMAVAEQSNFPWRLHLLKTTQKVAQKIAVTAGTIALEAEKAYDEEVKV